MSLEGKLWTRDPIETPRAQITGSGRRITKRQELHKIGVVLKRATPFLKINGMAQKTLGDF